MTTLPSANLWEYCVSTFGNTSISMLPLVSSSMTNAIISPPRVDLSRLEETIAATRTDAPSAIWLPRSSAFEMSAISVQCSCSIISAKRAIGWPLI